MPNIFYRKFCFDNHIFFFNYYVMLQDGTFQIDRLESLLTEVGFFRSVFIDATYPIQYSCFELYVTWIKV